MNKTCVEQLQGGTATKSWNPAPCSVRRQFFCQKPEGQCVQPFQCDMGKHQYLNIWMKWKLTCVLPQDYTHNKNIQ